MPSSADALPPVIHAPSAFTSKLPRPSTRSVLYTNMRSFLHKRDNVTSLVSSSNSDLVILTVTWHTADIADAELFDSTCDLNIFLRDRRTGRGGGILIAAKRNLFCSAMDVPSALEVLWVHVKAFISPLLFGACYRPHHSYPSSPLR